MATFRRKTIDIMILGLALFAMVSLSPNALAQDDSAAQWLERDFFDQNSPQEEPLDQAPLFPEPLPPDINELYPTAQELDDSQRNLEPGPMVYPPLAPSVNLNQESQPSERLPLPPPPVVSRPSGMSSGGESIVEGLEPGPGQILVQEPLYVPLDPNYVDQEFGTADQGPSLPQPEVEFEPLDPDYVDSEFGVVAADPAEPLITQPESPVPLPLALPPVQTTEVEAQRPEVAAPESQSPLAQRPEVAAPETQSPLAQRPEVQAPESQTPVLPAPEAQNPLAESSPEALAGEGESQDQGGQVASAPSGDITNLDVGKMVEVLKAQEGQPIGVGDSSFVWHDNTLYKRNPDGSLEPTGSVLSPNDTTFDDEGRSWLTQNEDGSVLINVSLRVWATINFAYNSSEIEPDSEGVLRTFSQALNRPSLLNKKLVISGHTDSTGSDLFNMGLSRRRAASVGQWLVENGHLSPDRLILAGYGSSMPVSDNQTEEGRALNRRVEFILIN
ncbi:MAG: OmpA family protein [Deltaproteobacteria bacterium]|nr:OmpA family protein [Deltaproteobacteria bacterium]